MKKISIIIPIYNVEKYLEKCLDSVINQSYKNLEIILVNDGSKDNCNLIIDKYAAKDSRIIALLKENGGLSDARNYGMKYVTGCYTMFIDSDDWIDREMVENLVSIAESKNLDIVQCNFYYNYEKYLLYENIIDLKEEEIEILNNKSAMLELIKGDKIQNYVCTKLYKSDLIKDVEFKTGRIFEDIFWMHHIIHKANSVGIYNKKFYYYLQREGSIVYSCSEKKLDILDAIEERENFIRKHYKELLPEMYKITFNINLCAYNSLKFLNGIDDKSIYVKRIKKYMRSNFFEFLKSCEMKNKIELIFFMIYAPSNIWIDKIYIKFRRRKKGAKNKFEKILLESN